MICAAAWRPCRRGVSSRQPRGRGCSLTSVRHRIAHRIHTLTAEIDEIDRELVGMLVLDRLRPARSPRVLIQISSLSELLVDRALPHSAPSGTCLIGGGHGRDYLMCHCARRRAGGLR
jgi:hypothetical protein